MNPDLFGPLPSRRSFLGRTAAGFGSLALAHLFLQRLEKITVRTVVGTLLVVLGVAIVAFSRNIS